MSLEYGFPPVAAADARLLILGSMPGVASLDAVRYYAHPRNVFWRIMGDLLGAGPALPYEQRLQRLTAAGIALWDVIGACRRRGSLDAAIDPVSIRINPIGELLSDRPSIARVVTHGGLASRLFARHLAAALPRPVEIRAMPSTSPANASWSHARKHAAWQDALRA